MGRRDKKGRAWPKVGKYPDVAKISSHAQSRNPTYGSVTPSHFNSAWPGYPFPHSPFGDCHPPLVGCQGGQCGCRFVPTSLIANLLQRCGPGDCILTTAGNTERVKTGPPPLLAGRVCPLMWGRTTLRCKPPQTNPHNACRFVLMCGATKHK